MRVSWIAKKLLSFLFPPREEDILLEEITVESVTDLADLRQTDAGESIYALFPYKNPSIKALIKSLKYHGRRRSAQVLAETLHDHLLDELSEKQLYENFSDPLLIPIPLHPVRFRSRGFNQTAWIAEELHKLNTNALPLCIDALIRIKNTKSQARQEKYEDRNQNLKHAFAVKKPEKIRNRNVILLDDVVTTGSTLTEAKNALLESGARRVICIALAH